MEEIREKIISVIEGTPGIEKNKLVQQFDNQEDLLTAIDALVKESKIKIVRFNDSELLYLEKYSNTEKVEQQVKTDENFVRRGSKSRLFYLIIFIIIGLLAGLICFTHYLDGVLYFGIILLIAFMIFKWVFSR